MMPANTESQLETALEEMRKMTARLEEVFRSEIEKMRRDLERMRAEAKADTQAARTELEHKLLEMEMRAATRTIEQTAATRSLYDMLMDRFELRDRVDRCEHELAELKRDRSHE